MAKPVICDRRGKVVPEEKVLPKPKFLPDTGDYHFAIEFNIVNAANKKPVDICGKCAAELIIGAGKKIREYAKEAQENKREFSLT